MRKLLLLALFNLLIISVYAQNLSYTCPRDTVLGCGVTCFNLVARFSDLKAVGDDYTISNVTNISFCRPYIDPGAPGPSANLSIDDRYSSVLALPFSFPFYGVAYNALVVSTNGFISFDISKTGAYSNFENYGDLPNTQYDPALIMGPYHDLDPSITTSPNQQIKYQTFGNAPNRKWILSFYKVPLFNCDFLFNNTHQIILHESSGIVEVHIVEKEICTSWNNGRAMIGLQDFSQTKAIMAPNRKMSDAPWGTTGMNESWRFIPSGGASLYRKVELLNGSGTVIATGDTNRINANTFEWTFNSVCPPANSLAIYVVKTTYAKINDPTNFVFSLDTVRILRNAMPAVVTAVSTTCGASNGSITATASGGTAPFMFVLNPGAVTNATGIFSGLAAGMYTVTITDATGNCTNTLTAAVPVVGTLTANVAVGNATCLGVNDGSLSVAPLTGNAPFSYSANGGPVQPGGTFTNLPPGSYTVVFTDATGCNGSVTRIISPGSSISGTSSSTPTSCTGLPNGTITVNGASGVPPYQYSLDAGAYQFINIFTGVSAGNHIISLRDSRGCTVTISRMVNAGTPITGTASSTATSCPAVNNGTITVSTPTGAGYTYSLNPGNMSNITGIFTGLAPATYTISFVNASGCMGSITTNTTVAAGPSLTSGFNFVNPACASINNGSISIVPQAGSAAPYVYTLTGPGGPFILNGNATVIFTSLAPGSYSYSFTDGNGCTGSGGPVLLTSNSLIRTPATVTVPLCSGNANGIVRFTASGGVSPYQYSSNAGITYQNSSTFNSLPAGTHTFRIRDNAGCIKDTSITLTEPAVFATVAAQRTTAGCSNNDGAIAASATGGTSAYTYTIFGGTVNNTGAVTGIFTGLAAGNYIVTAKDAKGCAAIATTSVLLADNMFLAVGSDTTICVESSVKFNPLTNPETSVFTWTAINTPLNTLDNLSILKPTATPTDTAMYILSAQWGGCRRKDTITVNVLHKPVSNAGKDTAICNKSYCTLTGTASNLSGTVNYDWSPATGVDFPNQAVTRVYPLGNDTTYSYTLTVTDNYGCKFSVTDAVNVRVQPPVPAYAGNDTIAVTGIPHQLYSSGGSLYKWSPAAALNNPLSQNPLATMQNDTKFIVLVTDVAGCIGYDTVFIKVYNGPTYYVPNAFSPNGDGMNDVFRAVPSGITSTNWFRIFNRYGQTVFETNEWLKGWDGNYRGKKQPVGAYIWIIKGTDRNGKLVEMKGTVMLLH